MSLSKDWLDKQIETENIKSFNYNEFSKIEKVGEGGFSTINKAYWKSRGMTVALKTLKTKSTICDFVKEVNLTK
jgi:serine/threonine protein kinase